MAESPSFPSIEPAEARAPLGRLAVIAVLLAALFLIGLVGITYLLHREEQRDRNHWAMYLGQVATAQAENVARWLEDSYASLNKLSENASLQLYLNRLAIEPENPAMLAEAGYLRNLLIVSAEQGGFLEQERKPLVPANVARPAPGGIALLGMDGKPLAATPNLPPLDDSLKAFIAEAATQGRRMLKGPYKDSSGRMAIAFAAPVYLLGEERETPRQVGVALGIRPWDEKVFSLLASPNGTLEKTAESFLVAGDENYIEFLTPLADGTAPLTRRTWADPTEVAAIAAWGKPGLLVSGRNTQLQEVLSKGVFVVGTENAGAWAVVREVAASEAFADTAARSRWFLTAYTCAWAALVMLVAALWWLSRSVEVGERARQYKNLARRYHSQERLLDLVTNSQPAAMFIVDEEARYRFANQAAAKEAGIAVADMLGKTMEAVLGPGVAKRHAALSRRALADQAKQSKLHRITLGEQKLAVQAEYIPLEQIALPGLEKPIPAVLVVERDITETIDEREKHERTLRQVVETLVAVVDRRDPYAANHSLQVSRLARAVAEEMQLEPVLVETAEIAGSLMNIGKILVPPEVLASPDALSRKDIRQIRESITASADMLEGIAFHGPVVETLRQAQERWDGKGPKSIAGKDILVTARIIAAANAFVGMLSPRAYRAGLTSDEAISQLMENVGKLYDRAVVVALTNYIDNKAGASFLKELGQKTA